MYQLDDLLKVPQHFLERVLLTVLRRCFNVYNYFQHLGGFIYHKKQDGPITRLLIGNNRSMCCAPGQKDLWGDARPPDE